MTDVRVSEDLWSTGLLPEGVLECWRLRTGADVQQGQPVAEVRIEGSVHEITAPASGRLEVLAEANSLVEPGSVIGTVDSG